MAIYTVQQGETIGDIVLSQTGDINNWDAICNANGFFAWVPILIAGQQIIIPDTIIRNLNNVRQFSQYPINNASVPDVYDKINVVFNQMVSVTTNAVTAITSTTATSGGTVTTGGGATIISRGVCWATTHNPVASGSHTTNGAGTGAFTSSITGLTTGTLYYVRAYAKTATGTTYGNEVSFTTS